jgi:ketosteroid isomerase-like protein
MDDVFKEEGKTVKMGETRDKHSPQANADLVQAFTQAMTQGNIEGIINLFSPDGEWVIMATGEAFRGPDQIRQLVSISMATRDHEAGMGLQPFNVFTNTDATKLCWEYEHRGMVTEEWPSVSRKPAPGTKFELTIILMCEIQQGRLMNIRQYFDLLTVAQAGTPHSLYSWI